jgi:hypothetical protein
VIHRLAWRSYPKNANELFSRSRSVWWPCWVVAVWNKKPKTRQRGVEGRVEGTESERK